MVKTFFDPNWIDLGALGKYGRWLGVNWVWSLGLTIYHCVFSVAIPILLVSLMFPSRSGQSWMSRWKLIVLFILWVTNGVVIFFHLTMYRPPVAHYLLAMVSVAALCILAWWLPQPVFSFYAKRDKPAHPFWFMLIGFLGTLILFFLALVLPNTAVHPGLTMLFMVGDVVFVGWIVLKMSGGGVAWSDRHRLALVAGVLGFFILLSPLQELDKNRTDNTTGMTIVSLTMGIFLFWMMRRVRRTEKSKATVDFA